MEIMYLELGLFILKMMMDKEKGEGLDKENLQEIAAKALLLGFDIKKVAKAEALLHVINISRIESLLENIKGLLK